MLMPAPYKWTYRWTDIGPLIPDFCWQTEEQMFSMMDELCPYLERAHFYTLVYAWARRGLLEAKRVPRDPQERGEHQGFRPWVRLYKRPDSPK